MAFALQDVARKMLRAHPTEKWHPLNEATKRGARSVQRGLGMNDIGYLSTAHDLTCDSTEDMAPGSEQRPFTETHVKHAIATVVSGADGTPSGLIAGLAFLESVAVGRMGAPELRRWFQEHLVRTRCMPMPASIFERSTGFVPLASQTTHQIFQLDRALMDAREYVIRTLRGLVLDPPDDHFLIRTAAEGRVWPIRLTPKRLWVPRPHEDDPLGDIVLSLFVADILSNRQIYDASLCVCEACGRVAFHARMSIRTRCRDHIPRVPRRPLRPL
jgi:hypothetical protein